MKTLAFIISALTLLGYSSGAASFTKPSRAVDGHSCHYGPIRIGVIDTGFDTRIKDAHLCPDGHKDFSIDNSPSAIPFDLNGHGTNIVGVINKFSKNGPAYCIVIIKYYSSKASGSQNMAASVKALEYANTVNLDVINYSGGGNEPAEDEKFAVMKFLNSGGILIAAAGNDGKSLDNKKITYYPAMYDPRIKVVGNLLENGKKNPSSNFGSVVKHWEIGTNQEGYGTKMTGTSQATAVFTGKTIAAWKSCDKRN
jgi:subtilisin family serine protease